VSRLPDIIGMGFRRCGSSWLHACLNAHPYVNKPKDGLHYYSNHFHRGEDWYRKELEKVDHGGGLVEYSVSYSSESDPAEVARRMAASGFAGQVFGIVRNPVERAFSDYRRGVSVLEIDTSLSFNEALERYPELVQRSRYEHVIGAYEEVLGRERVRIWVLEAIIEDPMGFWKEFCAFLGVDGEVVPSEVTSWGQSARLPRSRLIQNLLVGSSRNVRRCMNSIGLSTPWALFTDRYQRAYQFLINLNGRKELNLAVPGPELKQMFQETRRFLEDRNGYKLNCWDER